MALLITAVGPTVLRTWTVPDADVTLLTSFTAVTAVQGGTGLASYAQGDLLYASDASTLARLARSGTTGTFVRQTSSNIPGWSTLVMPNAATQGDLLIATAANVVGNLVAVAAGAYLRANGVGAAPVWSTLVLPNSATQGDLVVATGANTLGSVADVAVGQVLVSGGVSTVPAWSASPTLTSVLNVAGAVLAIGTSDAQGVNFQTSGSTRWTITIGGTLQPGASSTYALGDPTKTILAIYVDTINSSTLKSTTGTLSFDTTTGTGNVRISNANNLIWQNDNAQTIGTSASAGRPSIAYLGTALAVGTNPASAGAVRLASAGWIAARNAANSADLNIISRNASDKIAFGDSRSAAAVAGNFAANFYMQFQDGAGNNFYVPAMNASW